MDPSDEAMNSIKTPNLVSGQLLNNIVGNIQVDQHVVEYGDGSDKGAVSGTLDDDTVRNSRSTIAYNPIFEQDKLEPIAVIGLSLKFPQDAKSPESFWQMLVEGRSARTDVPANRFNVDAFYRPGPNRVGMMNVKGGHFIDDEIEAFDAPFFAISPTEASHIDPQQRSLLETTYHALENAGLRLERAIGSKTSVYIGSFLHDHETLLGRDPEFETKYKSTGAGQAMLSNRLSWFYNFTGPSFTLDTACSSSLNALHLACQSLRSRESTMGIVGGSNMFYNPDSSISMADLNFLSPDSKCFSFDKRANGYSRGEGVGVVVLKPLVLALQDGNTIRSVIRATGSNQDGRTPGITQPNPQAQETLIRQTYRDGGLDMFTTRYFEAHGTGTPVGDTVEASAINLAFQKQRPQGTPLFVGAVKTNIGHLEGASGVAGLIKTILVLENGIIPPNLNFEEINPSILAEAWDIKFPLENTPWPSNGLRRASINSFGFGGANAHCVLDDAYNYLRLRNLSGKHCTKARPHNDPFTIEPKDGPSISDKVFNSLANDETQPRLLVWSAFDREGLKRWLEVYSKHFTNLPQHSHGQIYLNDLAYTLSEKRSQFPWKAFTIAPSMNFLTSSLEHKVSRSFRSFKDPKLGFVFSGQGVQWYAMGRELFLYPEYRHSLEKADKILQGLGCNWSLIVELFKAEGSSRIDDPAFSQPMCVALQVGISDLLLGWGLKPSAVVGHSSGEIAAAYCAGGISLESAIKIAYYRGVIVNSLRVSNREPGRMIAVALSEGEIQPYLDEICRTETPRKICVACINSPNNVTVAGPSRQVSVLKTMLDQQAIFAKELKVDVAYHSSYMNDGASTYRAHIQDLQIGMPLQTKYTMYSSVTGRRISCTELQKSEYWVRNLVGQVKFAEAASHMCAHSPIASMKDSGVHEESIVVHHFLEIGPHGAMRSSIQDIVRGADNSHEIGYTSLLSQGKSAMSTTLEAAGTLYCLGFPINLFKVNHPRDKTSDVEMVTNLPQYPFNHTKKYWTESQISRNYRFRKHGHHELLGSPVSDWNPLDAKWRNNIRVSDNPWIMDHKVNGSAVYPAAGMLVMAIEAARQVMNSTDRISGYRFRDVTFSKALASPYDSQARSAETEFHLRPVRDSTSKLSTWNDFRLYVYENREWAETCRGAIAVEHHNKDLIEVDDNREQIEEVRLCNEKYANGNNNCKTALDRGIFYDYCRSIGLLFGPTFQTLNALRSNDGGEVTAMADLRAWTAKLPELNIQEHVIHPTALDAIFQLIIPAITMGCKKMISTMVPTKVQSLWISESVRSPEDCNIQLHTNAAFEGLRDARSSVIAIHVKTRKPCIIAAFQAASIATVDFSLAEPECKHVCYNIDWKPATDLLDANGVHAWRSIPTIDTPGEDMLLEQKNTMCYLTMSKALDELEQSGRVAQKLHIRNYIEWMSHRVSSNHTSVTPTYALTSWRVKRHDCEYLENLYTEVANSGAEGKLMVRVAKNLPSVLRGGLDSLSVLFEDSLIEEYYGKLGGIEHVFSQVAPYIDALAHENPGLRILEIGAGTGTATENILHILLKQLEHGPETFRFAEYVFTDVSSSFFEHARKRFSKGGDRMTYATLNIERDPQGQGFVSESYDLVVALNVLHSTANVGNALENVRTLLKPGGKLILYELTGPDLIRVEFIFGLLPAWWTSTEVDQRRSPLMTEQRWHEHLLKNGFSGIEFSLRNSADQRYHAHSAMISTRSHGSQNSHTYLKIIIITAENSSLQLRIAQQIKNRLQVMNVVDCTITTLQNGVATGIDSASYIFLPDLEQSFLHHISEERYQYLQKILQAAQTLLWVHDARDTTNPLNAMVTGLARIYRKENDSLRFTTLALRDGCDGPSTVHNIIKIFNRTLLRASNTADADYMEINGVLHLSRIVGAHYLNEQLLPKDSLRKTLPRKYGEEPLRSLKLRLVSPGLLNTLEYIDDPEVLTPLAPTDIEVRIKTSALNFRDLFVALGQVNDDTLGLEAAGIVTQAGRDTDFKVGDEVAGLFNGSFKTFGRCNAMLACRIPNGMDFNSAASMPIVFCTAYHALMNIARIRAGETILIHSGAGGLGQATVQLAKVLGNEIFVTVGTEEKKKLLMDLYDIKEDHIFSSRTLSFAKGIMRMTCGHGVDVVVNSLAGEGLRSSWECIAPFGRFIETGKKDTTSFGYLPMSPFTNDALFASIDLVNIIRQNPQLAGELMKEVFGLAAEKKISTPKPLQVYNCSQVEEALRLMQSGKNSGKLVIELGEDNVIPVVPRITPPYEFDSDATYLIAGGLGGIGRAIARWMLSRGAKNFILLSRSSTHSAAVESFLIELRAQSATVATPPCNIGDKRSLASVLTECSESMPPIKGCIQGAMVLENARLQNMSRETFEAAVEPKVDGSWNLHNLLPNGLDFFILLSSLVGIGAGGFGQSNYACGNAYQDALARYRVSRGEKAVSLNLGLVTSVGYLAEHQGLGNRLLTTGATLVHEADIFAVLEYFCNPALIVPSPLEAQVLIGLGDPASLRAQGIEELDWMQLPLFRPLHQIARRKDASTPRSRRMIDFEVAAAKAECMADVGVIAQEALVNKLADVLSMDKGDIDQTKSVNAHGVDSLAAVEIRQWSLKILQADIPIFEILGNLSIQELARKMARRSQCVKGKLEEEARGLSGEE